MLIQYCEGCGLRIGEADLKSGAVVQGEENKFLCADCAAKRAQTPRFPVSAAEEIPADKTTTHAARLTPPSATGRSRKATPDRARSAAPMTLLLAGGAGLLALVLLIWVATVGTGPHHEEHAAAKGAAQAVKAAPQQQDLKPKAKEQTLPVTAQATPDPRTDKLPAPTERVDELKPADGKRPSGGLLDALAQERSNDPDRSRADHASHRPDAATKSAKVQPDERAASAVETPKPALPPEQKPQVSVPVKATNAAGFQDVVPVGSPGNKADSTSFGSVTYPYRIGKYEVTNAHYCAFLNAVARTDTHGFYDTRMAGEYGGITRSGIPGNFSYALKNGWGNKPVNFVSWYDALRYANWLSNGQGNGSTETGSYTFSNANGRWHVAMPDHAALAGGKAAKWVLANENEWYKAAYFDPGKPGGAGYRQYAATNTGAPAANINTNAPSEAGSYKDSASAFGTFDQNGNMWEWNETQDKGRCGVRGGSFYLNDNASYMLSSTRYVSDPPTFKAPNYGFRVVLLGGNADNKAASAAAGARVPVAGDSPKGPASPKRVAPATFYVSQSSGNDSWTGQAPAPKGNNGPWKSLAKASTDYVPGDTILLKRGDTWNEELRPKGNGTPEKPITIGSYGEGAKPIIDRQDDRKDLFGIRLSDQEGFKIVGIEFARCMTGIYADYSAGSPLRKFIWIEDCYFRDSLLYGRYEDYPKRKIGLGISFFTYERANKIVLADITVKNCVFRRLASGVWTNNPDNFNKNASFIYNFGNLTFDGCLFEEGYQWQLGMRGVAGGAVRNCVTHDVGRGFRSFNGVAGAMFFRCKDWVFEDSEWGYVDIGLGSGDGEAFDFEGNCDNMIMRNCLFHDTDGPGFLLCCYASDGNPNKGILMENCVLNGKAKRPIGLPRCEIVNTTDWNQSLWKNCRFYLSKGEVLMKVMDPEKDKRSFFADCVLKDLSAACSTPKLAAKTSASSEVAGHDAAKAGDDDEATAWKAKASENQWLQLDFGKQATVNEFRLKEDPSSSVIRYVIECWDAKSSKWVGCFNGRNIGASFVAPIVSRSTPKARLMIMQTAKDSPAIRSFEAYNDTSGEVFNVPVGGVAPARVGR